MMTDSQFDTMDRLIHELHEARETRALARETLRQAHLRVGHIRLQLAQLRANAPCGADAALASRSPSRDEAGAGLKLPHGGTL